MALVLSCSNPFDVLYIHPYRPYSIRRSRIHQYTAFDWTALALAGFGEMFLLDALSICFVLDCSCGLWSLIGVPQTSFISAMWWYVASIPCCSR